MMREEKLDQEWVALILKAKKMGIPADEVRRFLGDGLSCNKPVQHNEPLFPAVRIREQAR
ncbi:MAG TPA: anti-repressor SinI family protein [Bacillales bacterium]|nr:anti-repressor SinI family protein [Bacillales bacterium]